MSNQSDSVLASDAQKVVCNGSCGNSANALLFFEYINNNPDCIKPTNLWDQPIKIELSPELCEEITNFALLYKDSKEFGGIFSKLHKKIEEVKKPKSYKECSLWKSFLTSDTPMRKKLIHLMETRHNFLTEPKNKFYKNWYAKLKDSNYYMTENEECKELFFHLKKDKYDDIIIHLLNQFCYSHKESVFEHIENNRGKSYDVNSCVKILKDLKKAKEYQKLEQESHKLNNNELFSIWAYSSDGTISSKFHSSHYAYQQCQWKQFYASLYSGVQKLNILHHKSGDEFPTILYHGKSKKLKKSDKASIFTIFSTSTKKEIALGFTEIGSLWVFKNANMLLKQRRVIAASIKWMSSYDREEEWLCLPLHIDSYDAATIQNGPTTIQLITVYSYDTAEIDISGHTDIDGSIPYLYTLFRSSEDIRRYKAYILMLGVLFNPVFRFKCPKCETESYGNDYDCDDIFEQPIKCPACWQYLFIGYDDHYLSKPIECYNPKCKNRTKPWIDYKLIIGKGLQCPDCGIVLKEWYDNHIKMDIKNIRKFVNEKQAKNLLELLMNNIVTRADDETHDILDEKTYDDNQDDCKIIAYMKFAKIFMHGWINFLLKLQRGINDNDLNLCEEDKNKEEEYLKLYLNKIQESLMKFIDNPDNRNGIFVVSRRLFSIDKVSKIFKRMIREEWRGRVKQLLT